MTQNEISFELTAGKANHRVFHLFCCLCVCTLIGFYQYLSILSYKKINDLFPMRVLIFYSKKKQNPLSKEMGPKIVYPPHL